MALKVVVVGGVAGGASAAARLRRINEDAEIIMLERGEFREVVYTLSLPCRLLSWRESDVH